jgi:Type II secretion system (T2SS), protein G
MVFHNFSLTKYHNDWKLHKGSAKFLRLLVSRWAGAKVARCLNWRGNGCHSARWTSSYEPHHGSLTSRTLFRGFPEGARIKCVGMTSKSGPGKLGFHSGETRRPSSEIESLQYSRKNRWLYPCRDARGAGDHRPDHGPSRRSRADLPIRIQDEDRADSLSAALDLYHFDNGNYRSSDIGITALVRRPEGLATWNGPYLKGTTVPNDPWGQSYTYVVSWSAWKSF